MQFFIKYLFSNRICIISKWIFALNLWASIFFNKFDVLQLHYKRTVIDVETEMFLNETSSYSIQSCLSNGFYWFFFLPLFGWRLCVCTNKVVTVCLVFLEFHIIKLIAIAISIRLFFLYHKIFSVYGRHPIAPFYNLQLLTHRIIRSRNWH